MAKTDNDSRLICAYTDNLKRKRRKPVDRFFPMAWLCGVDVKTDEMQPMLIFDNSVVSL